MSKSVQLFLPIVIGVSFALIGCNSGQEDTREISMPAVAQTPAASDSLMQDFFAFYRVFHQDSAFQMSRILWPLKGLPKQVDSATLAQDNFYWTQENWRMHRPVDFEMSEFDRELTPVGSGLIIERIVHRQGKFGMIRRFALIDDEWHLIYFADLNKFE